MSNRVWIPIGIIAGAFIVLLIGSALGAGVIYYLSLAPEPVFAAQEIEPDPNAGLIVTAVEPGSLADEAGVVRGDILLEIENQDVNSLAEVFEILTDLDEGDEIQLTLLHGDEVRQVTVTLETDYQSGVLGLRLCCGTEKPSETVQGIGPQRVWTIIEVVPDSPAEDAGLQVGDVILSVNGDEIGPDENLAEIISEFDIGDEISLEIRSRESQETTEIEVTLGEHPDETGRAFLGVRVALTIRSGIFSNEGLVPFPDEDGFKHYFQIPPFHRRYEFPFRNDERFDFRSLPFQRESMPFFFDGEGFPEPVIPEPEVENQST